MTITNQHIDDVLTTAFEGGITYWCSKATVVDGNYRGATCASETVSRGASIRLTVIDEGDGAPEPELLTRAGMVRGIREAAEHFGKTVEAFLDDCDAIYADEAVQIAVFGKSIFG